jgi:threonine/homoserine efflux transporter RhtA
MFSVTTRVVATLLLIASVAQLALGLAIAAEWIGPYEFALKRYTGEASSGAVINRAIYGIAFALGAGTLAEIGIAVRRIARRETNTPTG